VYRLDDGQYSGLFAAVRAVAVAVRSAFGATGITLLQHNEWDGGQDVFHMHVHVVPRHSNDGFYRGDERWPRGLEVVSLRDRQDQAARVRSALGAGPPSHPVDIYGDAG
jgi:histidine triad (HIT) family protein